MPIETPENAVESVIVEDLADLHTAMYDKMASISSVTDCAFLGFDSSKTNPTIPKIAMHISLDSVEIDRRRPTPLEGHRIEEDSGDEITETYDGEEFTGFEGRLYRYPLPVILNYNIDTWCHSAQTQLQMAQAIFQKFPERGVLTLDIDGTDYDFPIELTGIENLDDLSLNLRERLYRFRVEAWCESSKPDVEGGIIQISEIDVYQGNSIDDIDLPENTNPLLQIIEEPDE